MACFWIHCNICMKLPASKCRYYISNCSHVACDRCVEKKLIAPKCVLCKRDTKVEEVTKDLREDLRKYFINLYDFAVKSFNEITAIIDFQSKNCRRLMKHKMEKIQELQNTTIKHSEDAVLIATLQKQVAELQARNSELEARNRDLNTTFLDQQNMVNQLLSGNAANAMNVTPSFLHSSLNNAANVTQQDLFNLVNASYLNASAAPRHHNESSLQESILSPHTLALDQSSLNFGQQSFNLTSSSRRPEQSYISSLQQQVPEGFRTPSRVPQPSRQSASTGPSHRLSAATPSKSFASANKLNQSSRSWGGFRNEHSMMSTRTTQSAPSKSTLYKRPVVTAISNLRTPQPHPTISQAQRSRTACPHWPKSRCRCDK